MDDIKLELPFNCTMSVSRNKTTSRYDIDFHDFDTIKREFSVTASGDTVAEACLHFATEFPKNVQFSEKNL